MDGAGTRRIAIAALLAPLALAVPTGARSHGWYETECCHHLECAPIEKMWSEPTDKGLPTTYAQAFVGGVLKTTIIPPNALRRRSQDAKTHVCISIYVGVTKDPTKNFKCLYVPDGM